MVQKLSLIATLVARVIPVKRATRVLTATRQRGTQVVAWALDAVSRDENDDESHGNDDQNSERDLQVLVHLGMDLCDRSQEEEKDNQNFWGHCSWNTIYIIQPA